MAKGVDSGGVLAGADDLLEGDVFDFNADRSISPQVEMFLGVIARVAAPEELDQVAGEIIERLAANAPLSLKAIKQLLLREMNFRDGIWHRDIDRLVRVAGASEDAREGVTARLEKRAANFQGR